MNRQKDYRLVQEVIDNSVGNTWEDAVHEWDVTNMHTDTSATGQCVCGKENLVYLYEIRNRNNGNILYPIGSSCINKFGREDLDIVTEVYPYLLNMYTKLRNNESIYLNKEFFTKKVINYFAEEGVLDSPYNNNDGYRDAEFLRKMFLKRNKENVTENQKKKIWAILNRQIAPYVRQLFDKA